MLPKAIKDSIASSSSSLPPSTDWTSRLIPFTQSDHEDGDPRNRESSLVSRRADYEPIIIFDRFNPMISVTIWDNHATFRRGLQSLD